MPGLSLTDCIPLVSDSTLKMVTWTSVQSIGRLRGSRFRLRFELRSARLFSFWVSPSPIGPSNGFVAAGGPFRRGVELERASILDVAPTLLHLLGVPVSQEIEGRVLLDALEPSYRAAHPVRTVPRYDPAPPPAAVEEDTRAEDALREELRALGYIE